MSNIKLLDCTLRDGGYVNDWNFGEEVAHSLINSLVAANIDFVELGFLRDCAYDPHKTLYNNISEAKRFIPQNAGNTKFTLMSLHDKYTLDKLEDNDGTIFAIRVTFHNYDIDEGLEYVNRIKDKGYKVFCNPINIMGYSSDEFLAMLHKVNKISPEAFSIVDTFGSMRIADMLRLLYLCDHELDKDILLGCHLHENMLKASQLAETFVKEVSRVRNCVIDASLYGMGRVPGNLCIELMADFLNKENGNEQYSIASIMEAIDGHIIKIKQKSSWGYSPEYFLSAKYNLHRNYAEHYYSKGNITFHTIDMLLSKVEESKKSAFDANYADKLYDEQFYCAADNIVEFESLTDGKKVLLIAPGVKAVSEREKIEQFIIENDVVVFGINFISDIYPEINTFFGNEKRFVEYSNAIKTPEKVFITSNIVSYPAGVMRIDYTVASNGLVEASSSTQMLFNLLYRAGVKELWLAGFDGYLPHGENYFNRLFDNRINVKNLMDSHNDMVNKLKITGNAMTLHFLTESSYQQYL